MRPSPSAPLSDLAAAYRQQNGLAAREHRPWPVPRGSWLMGQSWFDLLFAHWRVEENELRRVVPPQLPLDIVDGSAWIAVTPFELRAFRLRLTLPFPLLSVFPELNVRTYVIVDERPGIYFFSLDAASRLAVVGARRAYRLPYFHASMSIRREGGGIGYRSHRKDPSGPPARLEAEYAPEGAPFNAAPGTVEASLIERYCAYTLDDAGAIRRIEIHHPPWELHRASAELSANTMTKPLGIRLEGEPMLHFAPRQDVVIWPLRPI
jgi:uncharacterized protein YqjF (DUF2071 family)